MSKVYEFKYPSLFLIRGTAFVIAEFTLFSCVGHTISPLFSATVICSRQSNKAVNAVLASLAWAAFQISFLLFLKRSTPCQNGKLETRLHSPS
jgi:hypothetical protein